MAKENSKKFRASALDNNGDVFAFESIDRERAGKKLAEFQGRRELHDAKMETPRNAGERARRYRVSGTDKNDDLHAFETGNRDRANAMLDEFRKRFDGVNQDMQAWM